MRHNLKNLASTKYFQKLLIAMVKKLQNVREISESTPADMTADLSFFINQSFE
jgi:hypothetical protein